MKLCNTHQHDLAETLKRKGLGRYIGYDKHKAGAFARRWLAGDPSSREARHFDVNVVATLEVYQKATTLFDFDVRHPGKCPLCAVPLLTHRSDADKMWLDNITDLMVVTAHTNGLRVGA